MGAEGVCVHVEVCYGKSGYLYACEGVREVGLILGIGWESLDCYSVQKLFSFSAFFSVTFSNTLTDIHQHQSTSANNILHFLPSCLFYL